MTPGKKTSSRARVRRASVAPPAPAAGIPTNVSLAAQTCLRGLRRDQLALLPERGLTLETLAAIFDDHQARTPELEQHAALVVGHLHSVRAVHSLRSRVKDPGHLVAKIIAKSTAETPITRDGYRARITDLIGVRALHLYKADWQPIHEFIMAKWDLAEPPFANYREGDPEAVLEAHKAAGLEVKKHRAGYRSIHYLVKFRPLKEDIVAEVQVRTIIEEAWSEIDHGVRYPDHSNDPLLAEFLTIFNRLAGSADEMGTFVHNLGQMLDVLAALKAQSEADQQRAAEAERRFEETVRELKIKDAEKRQLLEQQAATRATTGVVPLAGLSSSGFNRYMQLLSETPPFSARVAAAMAEVMKAGGASPGLGSAFPAASARTHGTGGMSLIGEALRGGTEQKSPDSDERADPSSTEQSKIGKPHGGEKR